MNNPCGCNDPVPDPCPPADVAIVNTVNPVINCPPSTEKCPDPAPGYPLPGPEWCKETIRAGCVIWGTDPIVAHSVEYKTRLTEIILKLFALIDDIGEPGETVDIDPCTLLYLFNDGEGVYRPYADVDEVATKVGTQCRAKRITVLVDDKEYWYKDGVNLVEKTAADVTIPAEHIYGNGVESFDLDGTNYKGLGGALLRHTLIGGAFKLGLTDPGTRFGVGIDPTTIFHVMRDSGHLAFNGKRAYIKDIHLNTWIGDDSALYNDLSTNSLGLGNQAGYAAEGNNNVFLGPISGHSVRGSDNIMVGRFSGLSTDGIRNVMIGALSGINTFAEEAVMIGYDTSAGDPILERFILNTAFNLTDTTFSGTEVADIISDMGLIVGQRVAMSFSSSSIQVGGVSLPGGGLSFKGVVINASTIEMWYQGRFTSQGSGSTRIRIYPTMTNVIVIGRHAHATKSNQSVIGDSFVDELKVGTSVMGMKSGTFGFPRMTTSARNALTGLIGGETVYDTNLKKLCFFANPAWEVLTSS